MDTLIFMDLTSKKEVSKITRVLIGTTVSFLHYMNVYISFMTHGKIHGLRCHDKFDEDRLTYRSELTKIMVQWGWVRRLWKYRRVMSVCYTRTKFMVRGEFAPKSVLRRGGAISFFKSYKIGFTFRVIITF